LISSVFILLEISFAALSRMKYSFDRRVFDRRNTSILSIIGECRGKIRSTPHPFDDFRTVKVAPASAPCFRDNTRPSKIWIRVLPFS